VLDRVRVDLVAERFGDVVIRDRQPVTRTDVEPERAATSDVATKTMLVNAVWATTWSVNAHWIDPDALETPDGRFELALWSRSALAYSTTGGG